jgi:DNA-binding transcriptional LysR family regulator
VLVTVVDEGGFTAAANELGMTQSGVSQAVQALEEAVGVALLSRGRERIAPTEIGLHVLSEARAALRAVERVREHCAGWAGLNKGTLRIGSVASAATRMLPDRLRAFRTRYPGIEIVLLEGTDGEVCEWVVRNAVDIGLTAECSTDLHGEVIAEDDFVVVVERRHRLASTRPISIRDLADQPFIMSGAGCEPTIRSFFADVACTPRVAFTVRDMTALFEMVRQGLGVTIVPSLSLPSDRANLRVLELKPARCRRLLAVTRTPQPLVPAAEAFLGLLRLRSKPRAYGR